MQIASAFGAAWLPGLALGWNLLSWWWRPAPITLSAWAADWSDAVLDDTLQSVEKAGPVLAQIDVFRLRLTDDGGLSDTGPLASRHQKLFHAASERGISRALTLVNDVSADPPRRKDPDVVQRMLADPERRAALISAVAERLKAESAVMLDLDFEQLHVSDRDAFSAFVADLATRLHADGKKLAVTVQPQLQPETRDGPGAEDLAALGRAADEVRVMAYHVHFNGTDPGASAPLPWVRALLTNVLRSVPARKLVLAVYVGGWRWQNGHAEQIAFDEAMELARTTHAERGWSDADGVPFFKATTPDGALEVWYENACSLGHKVDLARQLGLRGVALWRLGQEDPALYAAVRDGTPC